MLEVLEGLIIHGLSKNYAGKQVVSNLDLTVERGELVVLLGPSGCGKTTTLRMIAGFLNPDSGTIHLSGKDITHIKPEKRPSAMVFQNYALWPHMSVFDNVAFPLKVRKLDKPTIKTKVHEVLERVNLMHHIDSKPKGISGGEQQRVALARALIQEPSLLLLDEPLSNLDAKLRVKVRDEIRQIQKESGITTIMVTHDQDEAFGIADRIAVMNKGKIEQFDIPDQIYANPATFFVANFVGFLNKYEAKFENDSIVLGDFGSMVGIRPEDIVFSQDNKGIPVRVDNIIPHGHFSELVLKAEDLVLRSFVSGKTLTIVGDIGYAKIMKAHIFVDDIRTETIECA